MRCILRHMGDPFDFQVLRVLQPGRLPANRARYQIFNGKKELLASAADTERRPVRGIAQGEEMPRG
jgi:hypothetical protein